MKKPVVSVVIAAYNEEKNIERLLKSVNNQKYPHVQAIVVDDQSTDNTAEIAKKYTKYVYTGKHAERSVQRNFGVSKAKGKYVLILDGDMELTPNVIGDAVYKFQTTEYKALIVPEETTGRGFIPSLRKFEREMYKGDITVEVARFFEKSVFDEVGGYDPKLTGTEDYDLPYRIMKKYKIGWIKSKLYHHEKELTLWQLLKKKYYYASNSVVYADKHPELVSVQGTIVFRKAYLKNWRKFVKHPLQGIMFILVRTLTAVAAVAGFISKAGIIKFMKTLFKMLISSSNEK